MKTIKFYTLGCKVNQYETQSIRERFLRAGFKEVLDGHKADIYLVNTCTVTHRADKDSRYYIKKARKQNPRAKIIATGCIVGKGSADLSWLKGADYLISKSFFPDGISEFCGHTRAFLKVQDGCNNFCSYCIVPYTRGRSRSRSPKEVICEARKLVNSGFKEIVLTGVCLGVYGKDLKPQVGLADIISELEEINGLLRIRLSSIEAGDVSDELITRMAKSKKLCRHLHIPLQSGDGAILKKMNRKYTSGDYLKLIVKLKKKIPWISITTDVMVGFPGETEKNFENTLRMVKKIMPLKAHIFPYSERNGTLAADYVKDNIPPDAIKQRTLRLKNVSEACACKFKKKFLGRKAKVLIEDKHGMGLEVWEGLSDNYLRVLVRANRNLKGQLVSLRLKELQDEYILAHLP